MTPTSSLNTIAPSSSVCNQSADPAHPKGKEMKRFTTDEKGAQRAGQTPAGESAAGLSSLLNYPALGRLFESPRGPALAEMRERLRRTNQDLERVIRQAPKDEADRAARVARAYAVTLALLDEAEEIKPDPGP